MTTTDTGTPAVAHPADGIAVITMPTMLDKTTAVAVRDTCESVLNSGVHRIVADLTAVEFTDSTGLGVLVGTRKRARAWGGTVVLVVAEKIAKPMRITGVAADFDIYGTVGQAIAALGAASAPETAMSSTDATGPGTVVIRYRNQSGALVTVSHRVPRRRLVAYGAECTACLDDTDSHFEVGDTLKEARVWANAHAAECRALPQPETQD